MTEFEYDGPEWIEAGRNIIRIWENEFSPLNFTLDGPADKPVRVQLRREEFFMTMEQARILGEWLASAPWRRGRPRDRRKRRVVHVANAPPR
jgi:hypothetical protein